MNTLAERFVTNSTDAEIRKVRELLGDDEEFNAMWGSEAGFGSLASGIPKFNIPSVPNVRDDVLSLKEALLTRTSIAL